MYVSANDTNTRKLLIDSNRIAGALLLGPDMRLRTAYNMTTEGDKVLANLSDTHLAPVQATRGVSLARLLLLGEY